VRFESGDGFDYAIGHAEKAYDGKLTKAERAIVYLRPDTIVVRDVVASATPRTWEWNIHALNRIAQSSNTKVTLRNGPAQMCVELVSGPEVVFTQTDQFTARPSSGANQWHGTFASTVKSPAAEFIAVMRVGADCPAATTKRVGDASEVAVGGKTVSFSSGAVTVR
jgi:hypothetical protein